MKIIGLVFLFLGISSAQACEVNSAQFIGNVRDVRDVRIERIDQGIRDCFFKISFTQFSPAFACPVYPGEASYIEFADLNCSYQNGDEISGVIIEKAGVYYIE